MLSKSQISFIKSLQQKKVRKAERKFVVEGIKLLEEFIYSDFHVEQIVCLPEISPRIEQLLSKVSKKIEILSTNYDAMQRMSAMVTASDCLAVVHERQSTSRPALHLMLEKHRMIFVLDEVKDPGNLGTIIRIADWFGHPCIICSENTVEAFNPKTIQASMGSISRIPVYYENLEELLKNNPSCPAYVADLEGIDVLHEGSLIRGMVILGSESHGPSTELKALCANSITIPRIGSAESLNVAIAAGIIAAELSK